MVQYCPRFIFGKFSAAERNSQSFFTRYLCSKIRVQKPLHASKKAMILDRIAGTITFLRLFLLLSVFLGAHGSWENHDSRFTDDASQGAHEFLRRGTSAHTDNWAVLVCTSRFWFNYRLMMPRVFSWPFSGVFNAIVVYVHNQNRWICMCKYKTCTHA
jgi:hypothetical protein